MESVVIIPFYEGMNTWLGRMVSESLKHPASLLCDASQSPSYIASRRVVFAIELSETGTNMDFERYLARLTREAASSGIDLSETVAGMMISSPSESYTKSYSRSSIFRLNKLGIQFIGLSLVEATSSLKNFERWKSILGTDSETALKNQCASLMERLSGFSSSHREQKLITAIHASNRKTSNTISFWDLVSRKLSDSEMFGENDISEIFIASEVMNDCMGCSFESCIRFGKSKGCFFDDYITNDILDRVDASDIIVFICPNYNDSISAKIMAVINRLTVLYRKRTLSDKLIYGVIISGNSGGDCLAEQLIGSLNINKGFHLPSKFAFLETANRPLSILDMDDIDEKALEYANVISKGPIPNL